MGVLDRFQSSPSIRPMLNLGCLFDIPTGTYHEGEHGEHILNGGLAHVTGVGGRGNTYKSTVAHFQELTILDRYRQAEGLNYDTELSLTYKRLTDLARRMPHIGNTSLENFNRLILTDKTTIIGNKWFEEFRSIVDERHKAGDKIKLTTPFLDSNENPIKIFNPFVVEVDSLSMMDFDVVEEMYNKNEVGASGLNTEALTGARVKSQMLNQMSGLTSKGGVYIIFTAHVGDEHKLDPYAPSQKKLSFLKSGIKFKRVPETFTFLTNNLWFCLSAKPLVNKGTKGPEFPRSKEDDLKGDTDLMVIEVANMRAKSGPTGIPFELIASQSEGILRELSEFWYIKNRNRFGLGGNDKNYYLEILPEVALSRTTVRGKIDENPKLQRGLEITSEICQMKNLWQSIDRRILPDDMQQIYDNVRALGFDWDILLGHTRGYWMFDEDITKDTPYFLSSMDVLLMAKGEYVPWWYEAAEKKHGKAKSDNTQTESLTAKAS